MELIKQSWNEKDVKPFEEYLLSLSKGEEKAAWEKRIVNTSLPCIAVPATEVKRIVNQIAKGNYRQYIDLWLWNNFTQAAILGGLIVKEKDFNVLKSYLDRYVSLADSWATTDTLKFKINKNNQDKFFNVACEYILSEKPFVRRTGLLILFKLLYTDAYLDSTFKIMDSLSSETEYYVNMMVAWLLAECFTKHRDKTLEYLKNNKLNKFQINKCVSKCRDSFRISAQDKEMLKTFKK